MSAPSHLSTCPAAVNNGRCQCGVSEKRTEAEVRAQTSRRDEMVLEHASLVQACARLMNGEQPDWDTILLSKNTRKQIVDIAQRLRIVNDEAPKAGAA